MSEQELKEFLRAMSSLREANTATPEKAREFLKAEGVLTGDGKLTERYAPEADTLRK